MSDDTKRLDFLQSWCDDMFWTRERNAVGEPRLMLSWFIGDGGSPAFATTGDDWRDAIDQARVKMGDVARSPLSVVDTTRSNVPWLQCPKAPHDKRDGGYLHDENDDRPYDVDGLTYCGRCHFSCNEATQRCEHLANAVPSGRDPGGEG